MADQIEKVYEEAIKTRLLPGVSLIAGDKDGNIIYSKSFGRLSSKEDRDLPFTEDTVCAIASMTKLMTAVASLRAVEEKLLDLDTDTRPLLPEMGKYGIITGFDDDKGEGTFVPDSTPITLRMLLSHTSGHEYDWLHPLLGKWRASRNEIPYGGPTVEHKAVLPLTFKPGTGFAYGLGNDWAGKLIEVTSGLSLEDYMHSRIWKPLGIENDISFWPNTKESMRDRRADMSTLDANEQPPAVDGSFFDLSFGTKDCLGGGGLHASGKAYFTFLSAVMRRDPKLLTPESYTELFRPQLDEQCEQVLNDYIAQSPTHTNFLSHRIPASIRKTWSFAGLIAKEGQEGRFAKGTTFWAGVANTVWFIDHETGICGSTLCQLIPPLHPPILELHAQFQRQIFEEVRKR